MSQNDAVQHTKCSVRHRIAGGCGGGAGVVDGGGGGLFWFGICYLVWIPEKPTLKQTVGKEVY